MDTRTRSKRAIVTTLAAAGIVLLGVSSQVATWAAPLAIATGQTGHAVHSALPAVTAEESADAAAFQEAMRRLWEDHIVWTRLYIVSFAADLPDQDVTAQRLLRNQTDIGDAIKPFYGDEAGDQLTKLLDEHITGAVALLNAAKSGDQQAIETASANWYANADAIAVFLNQANPDQWPLAGLRAEMKSHLDLTLNEATDRLQGDYAGDIAAYDQIQNHILRLADLLSSGIVAQFPDRFA